MGQLNIERKLAAILSADVQGFSRLMDEDEEATLHALNAYRAVIDPLIHQGSNTYFWQARSL
jgi:class 3 adenylate cyclase